MGREPGTHLVVSYMPLLEGEAGIDLVPDSPQRQDLDEQMRRFYEEENAHVAACLWQSNDDGRNLRPTLIMERAHDVLDHLVKWSDRRPTEWFSVQLLVRDDGYCLAVIPEVRKSVDRYKMAYLINHDEPVAFDAKYQVLFHPLMFATGSLATMNAVAPRLLRPDGRPLQERMTVGFLNRADFRDDLTQIDQGRIRWLEGVPMRALDDTGLPYLTGCLDKAVRGGPQPL